MDATQQLKADKAQLLALVTESPRPTTGALSTKDWAENAVWFDIPAFASKGIAPASAAFDRAFSNLSAFEVDILDAEFFINGNMAIVCTIQKWKTTTKDGVVNPPLLVRQTNGFEKQAGQWKVIHEHSSIPSNGEWDGTFITNE